MPTSRSRYRITETPAVARALDLAAERWPDKSRADLLRAVIDVGGAALEHGVGEQARRRRAAVRASSGKCEDAFGPDYLAELRRDWPA